MQTPFGLGQPGAVYWGPNRQMWASTSAVSPPWAARGLRRWAPARMRLGQEDLPEIDPQTQATVEKAIRIVSPIIDGAMAGALAWVGFATGSREKGFLSVLGYMFGGIGVLRAGASAVDLVFAIINKAPATPQPAPEPFQNPQYRVV